MTACDNATDSVSPLDQKRAGPSALDQQDPEVVRDNPHDSRNSVNVEKMSEVVMHSDATAELECDAITYCPTLNTLQSKLLKNYIALKIGNIPTHAMVDSGADISCASTSVIQKYGLHKCKTYPSDVTHINTASGEKVPIQGIINVKAEVVKQRVSIKFYLVPDLHCDFILGVDWLEAHHACIRFGSGTLSLDPRRQLAACSRVSVPPRSEKIVVARIRGKRLPAGVLGTTSSSPFTRSAGLGTAGVLDHVRKDGSVFQRVINTSDKPIELSRGSVIGKFTCLSGQDRAFRFGDCSDSETGQVNLRETPFPTTVTADEVLPAVQSVVTNHTSPLISQASSAYRPSVELDFSHTDLVPGEKDKLCELVDEFSGQFMGPRDKIGKCELIKHKVRVDPEQKPAKHRAYRLAPKQKEAMEKILRDLEAQDIIEPSVSPWSAPCLLVAKKNNSGSRFVVDYRSLNKATVLDAHPLPTPNEALESLGERKPAYFTTMDLAQGFYQLVIDEESRPYTAFRCHLGLYQFKRLPMGLKNSPSTFQRTMEAIMRGLTWKIAMIYMDDIVVFSPTFEQHLVDLRQVLERLKQANLKLKPSKCFFARRTISYLGHTVTSEGIHVDPEKIEAVRSYPAPRNLKDLRSFLGMTGYYRRFVESYASIASPLYRLTKSDVPFVWTEACEKAFQQLKEKLITAPILAYPDFTKPFRVHTDASGFAIGAVLCQEQSDKTIRPIAYAGRSLNDAERNYGITEKECLAFVYAAKQFECYLRYNHFIAVVDHAALQWLLNLEKPSGRLMRWRIELQFLSYTIQYRPGRVHSDADGLSRRRYTTDTDPHTQEGPNVVEAHEDHVTVVQATPDNTNHHATGRSDAVPSDAHSSRSKKLNECLRQAAQKFHDQGNDCDPPMATVKKLQREDPHYVDIIAYLADGTLPNSRDQRQDVLNGQSSFFLYDGVLFHIWTKDGRGHRTARTQVQLAVPKPLVRTVLELNHDSPLFGGHFGMNRTLERIRLKYYWPTLNKDVVQWVRSCIPCNQKKAPPRLTKAQIVPMPVASEPFERVSTDILGPFSPPSKSGKKFVLVFVDYLTKYMELVPLENVKSETVARAFIDNVICRHGVPRVLHSDRGTQYLSHLTQAVCRLLNVTKTNTTSWHPQCNGQSERMMSTIAHALSKHIDGDYTMWDRYLPQVQFAYNTSPCIDSTEYTPFFLVHGRHPRTILDAPLAAFDTPKSAADFIVPLLEDIEMARKVAIETLKERKTAMKEKADMKANQVNFQLGDTVYLYKPVVTPGHSRKLLRPWLGPFYVCQKLSPIHVRLRRRSDGKLIANRVHIDRLKHGVLRSNGPDDPTPPTDIDATEPAVLGDSEVPADNWVDENSPVDVTTDDEAQDVVEPEAPTDSLQPQPSQIYEIEKVLRKKYIRGKWTYRVKWVNFDKSHNSWVDVDDLTPQCKTYVQEMHNKIPTDRRSQKKH